MVCSLNIKNGKIVDGTGNPWFKADICVKGSYIAKISRNNRGKADNVIEADGLIVCPGFIDTHTHSDGTILLNNKAESAVRQGITTQVIGNCGCGFAPINPFRKDELNSYIRRLLPVKIESKWLTFREYMRQMAHVGCSTNIVALLTHGAIRIAVMGFNEVPTPEKLGLMKLLVTQGMEAGAIGISTGLIYPPCIYAKTAEIIELCKIVAKYHGIFVIHVRGEGTNLIQAIEEALEISKKAGVRTHISHHKATGKPNWGKTIITLKMIEEARRQGLEITFDQYPYTAGATVLCTLLPSWTHVGGLQKLILRLKDPKIRSKIRKEMERKGKNWENMVYNNGWENIFISILKTEGNKKYEGKNMSEIKEMRGDPDEFTTLFNILLEEDGEGRMVVFSQDEEEMKEIMKHPLHMVGSDGRSIAPYGPLSVGKPHPRFFGTFPRFLGRYVREEGVLRLEDAIRRITSYPAQTFNIENKGLLKENMDADIVVFNPDVILDKATYKDPMKYPIGIEYVIVNGKIVVEQGKHTGAIPGKIISYSKDD